MVSLISPTENEMKIIFAGPVGSGKTTAIRVISDKVALSTEVEMSEGITEIKNQTTVGFDYGKCEMGDGFSLHLYGTPGQERFRFMWDLLAKGAFGLIVLADHSRSDPIADVIDYLQAFAGHFPARRMVVGVGRLGARPALGIEQYVDRLTRAGFDIPVLDADVRRDEDVRLLLSILISMAEVEID